MQIVKFGGTSLSSRASLQRILQMFDDYQTSDESLVLVVSALKGVTNVLCYLVDSIARKDNDSLLVLEKIQNLHWELVSLVFSKKEQVQVKSVLTPLDSALKIAIRQFLSEDRITVKEKDFIIGFGEIYSGYIINCLFQMNGFNTQFVDSRKLIVTDNSYGNAHISWDLTEKKIKHYFSDCSGVYVVTGYIGASISGDTTTLGRGGSDYTAAIFGTVLNAKSITKWTDVDGIMTADPNEVLEANPLPNITFDELLSLSRFGPKVVVHGKAIYYMAKRNIPFIIRNTFNHDFPGTLVSNKFINGPKIIALNRKCIIVGLKNKLPIARKLVKKIYAHDGMFFRLRSNFPDGNNKSYYLVSKDTFDFFNDMTIEWNESSRHFRDLFTVKTYCKKICLIAIIRGHVCKLKELRRIKLLLSHKGLSIVNYRIFHNTLALLLHEKDASEALNFLHEEFNNEYKLEI